MIAPQSPSLQVFVAIERVSRADMASEHFSSIATIQANDIIAVNGSPHRYSRCENFLCLNGLSEVTQRVMNCGDQVRKLLWSHRVVPNVAADGAIARWRGIVLDKFGGTLCMPFAVRRLATASHKALLAASRPGRSYIGSAATRSPAAQPATGVIPPLIRDARQR